MRINHQTARRYLRIALNFSGEIGKMLILAPVARLLYHKKKVWLISERGTDARDNGYHFFRYLRQQHPEIECRYVITKDSPDRERVASLGKVVNYRSLRHYLLFWGSRYLISTHHMGFAPNREFACYAQRMLKRKVTKGKTIMLRHGVGKDNTQELHQENTHLDMLICGAKPEYDYIAENWHYQNGEVRYTGLARFDFLHDFQRKRQILIMPTWRMWLKHGPDASEKKVLESDFFRCWDSLLNCARLAELAEKFKIRFLFYPHYEVQKYIDRFSAASTDIVLADFAHFDVQQLLKESMLLITDFSSVFFDFAYMRKPVLYYQFDEEEYRAHHYVQGYFDYRRDGFGEVVTKEQALLDLLEQYLEEDCRLKPMYRQRIQGFFPLHDNQNCQRIYNEIIRLT